MLKNINNQMKLIRKQSKSLPILTQLFLGVMLYIASYIASCKCFETSYQPHRSTNEILKISLMKYIPCVVVLIALYVAAIKRLAR